MKRRNIIVFALIALLLAAALLVINYFFPKKYQNSDFGIETYISATDRDGDGIDDQTDILAGVREYIKTKPKYKSKYYAGGWPDDGFGVCTDVVAQGLLSAGYDLQYLVDEDIRRRPDDYSIEKADDNIDFRRVRNLLVYFSHTAISLTTDPYDIAEWQGGDIVVFEHHIGIVSDRRNRDGIPCCLTMTLWGISE